MRRFAKMDNRLSRSMPMLLSPAFISPVTYRVIHPRWPERRHQPRHFYVGGVRTKLIGANSYPNPSHSPQRLVLCGASGGSYQKLTRCSSTAELSRTGVFCSSEDLRDQKLPRRALSCEDVCRGASTSAAAWDSRFSESGVSLSDSRTDLGSLAGTEDVDGVSQCSFGSSSAFHEITGDSELDRPDSDCLSVPGSLCGQERALDVVHEGGGDPQPRGHWGDRHGAHGASRKHRHDSGSREKFLTELTASSSGRSSPCEERKEFYHSTPTKRGSPVLSIFPGDEEDLHFPSRLDKESPPLRDLPRDSLPPSSSSFAPSSPLSPRGPAGDVAAKTRTAAAAAVPRTSTESIPSSVDTVREVLKRSRQEFFSSLQDCAKLEEQTTGESVQSWLTTGHTQRRALVTEPPPPSSSTSCEAESSNLPEPHPHQRRQQPSPQSPLSGARLSVRERVRALEQGQDSQIDTSDRGGPNKALEKGSGLQAESCSGENGGQAGAEASLAPAVAAAAGGAEVGGAARFPPRQLKKQPPSETASQQRGNHGSRSTERAGGYELSQFGGGRDGETRNSARSASSSSSPVLSSSPVHFADSPSREGDVKNQARDGSEDPRNQSGRWDAETAPRPPPPGSIDVDDGVTPPPTATTTTAQLTTTVAYRSAVVSGADSIPDDDVNNDSGAQPRGYSGAKAANSESKSAGLTGTDSDHVKAAGFADREAGIATSFYTVTDDETADGHGADLYSRDADVNKRAAGILSWLERGGEVEEEEATTREESEKRCDYNHNAGHALGGVAATAHSSTSSRQDKGGPDNPTSPSTPSFNAPAASTSAPSPVTAASDTSASLATLPPPDTDADQQVVCTRLQGVADAPPSATMSAEHTPGFQRPGESAAPETVTTGTDGRPEEEAPLVDGSEQHMPPSSPTSSPSPVTVLEVSRRHTRHVHRTTVQETVTTTHRTVRHGAASPTAPPVVGQTSVSYANGGGEGSGLLRDWDTVADSVTDRTVSTTVREEEDSSEREETSTSSFTRRPEPLPRFDTGGGRSEEGGECCHPHRSNAAVGSSVSGVSNAAALNNESVYLQPVDAAAADAATHLSTPSHPATLQQHRGGDDGSHGEESSRVMAGSGPASHTSAKYSLLDSLQEQLSLLSSEDVSFTSDAQSPRQSGQVSGYRDHAEASLPKTAQSEVVPLHGDDAEDKAKRVRGTGSVCIKLARGAVSGSTFATFDTPGSSSTDMKTDYLPSHGPAASEVGRETSLRHARVSQILSTSWGEALSSDEGEGRDGERGMRPESPLLHSSPLRATGLVWRPPASSSSELDDSDGNYSSISTTDSSRPPHGHSESDLPASEGGGAEDYDNVHSFHDFVSGLQGQSTSDQPSLHHSADMAAADVRSGLLRSTFIQETILEADDESETADDESETADELDTTDTTVSSFRSSLHFSLPPPQSTPKFQAVSPAPEIRLWSTDQHVSNLSATEEDVPRALSPVVHPLQELSDRLSSVSGDLSYELAGHAPTDSRLLHHHPDDLDLSGSRHSACSSPAPSDVSEGSVYSASATAEVRKQAELGASFKSAEPAPTQRLVRRNLSSALETSTSRRSQWVQEKALLFQRLLNDFEWQSRSSEQKLLDEMCSLETQGRGGEVDEGLAEKRNDACDDLYRAFTREYLEKRQNHVCPFIEDHLPVFRFRRFLRKKHNSKLAGHRTFRLRHRLARLTESPLPGESAVKSVSDRDLSKLRQTPYSYQYRHASKLLSPSGKPKDRLVSDVFTDDADVKRSFSDSAYSTCTSRGDVSSIGTDLSMDSDKLTSLSDVFDQLDVCEGEIDQALLDRLRVGHYKAETL